MNLRTLVWACLWTIAGVLLVGGWFPGADGVADGPRVGMAATAFLFASLLFAIPLVTWTIRKTTRPEDYEGNCPVGRACPACGAFNFNPRTDCRHCGTSLEGVAEAERQAL